VWAKKERKAGKITRTWPSVDTDNAEAGTTRSILDLHGLLHPRDPLQAMDTNH